MFGAFLVTMVKVIPMYMTSICAKCAFFTSLTSSMTLSNHNVGRRYIGMARMPASRNTFSKPPNSQTKKL